MLNLISYLAVVQADCDVDKARRLFGVLPKWYKYLPYNPEDITNSCAVHIDFSGNGILGLLPIGLAIIEILLSVAGLVAVGFVIYGGFQYVTSQGEPDRTKAALHTIINAFVGGAITVVASAIVAFLANRLTI
jgi:hypothetical protein